MIKKALIILFLYVPFSPAAKTDSLSRKKTYKNAIVLSAANFSIAGLTKFDPYIVPYVHKCNQFGLAVEHKIDKHLWLNIGYNEWSVNPYLNRDFDRSDPEELHDGDRRYPPGHPKYNEEIGGIRFRHAYRMADASVNYKCNLSSKHKISGGIGLSYTWGTNIILDYRYYNYAYTFFIYTDHTEHRSYAGLVIPIKYDYLIFKKRIAIGVQSNARKYLGLYSWQIDYGVHMSVNI